MALSINFATSATLRPTLRAHLLHHEAPIPDRPTGEFHLVMLPFLSAFSDRSAPAFRKLVSELAWGTFAWFRSEPEKLLALRHGQKAELVSLFKY